MVDSGEKTPPSPIQPQLLTRDEVANLLRISRRQVQRLAEAGVIPG